VLCVNSHTRQVLLECRTRSGSILYLLIRTLLYAVQIHPATCSCSEFLFFLFWISLFYRYTRSGAPVFHEHDEQSLYSVEFEWREHQMTQRVRLAPAVSYLDFVFSCVPIHFSFGKVSLYVCDAPSSVSCLTRISRSEARISECEHQLLLDVTPTDQQFSS
jgi:hypothetical protein